MQVQAHAHPDAQPQAARRGRGERVSRDAIAIDPALQVDRLSPDVEERIADEYRHLLERYGVRADGTRPGMPDVAKLFASTGLTAQGWARVVGWRT
jgi:hypothetical protein